ncbi:zinc finger protein 260-like isoform X1 [Culicoides brevitarsis]|uniref:zinc finger protein 260-like isoform X1 n=1 Tax=Culicoides brevitarsis TaxID=469753 RepID=UPI00307C2F9E
MDQILCSLCLIKKQTLIHMLMLPDKIKVDPDYTENIYNQTREKVHNLEADSLCERCLRDLKIVETFRQSCLHSEQLITQISTNISDNHRILLDDVFIDVSLYEGLDEFYVSPMNVVEKSSMAPPSKVEMREEYNEDIVYDPIVDQNEMMDTTLSETEYRSPVKREPKVVFKCDKCKKQYATISSLDMHRYKFHKGPPPGDLTKRRLKVDVASPKDIYYGVDLSTTCEYCFTECASNDDLKLHVARSHPKFPRNYTCKACSKELKTKETLRAHFLMIHTDERREFQCSHCDKAFFHKRSLTNHEEVQHLGTANKFICDICGLKSNSRGDLHKHKLRHEKIKQHECPYEECGKRFTTKYQLTLHKKFHENIRNHKCTYCEKSFVAKCHLDDHLQCHLKEKKYSCDLCNNAFSRKRSLDKHLKVHYGIRDFLCNMCPYKCRSTDQLKQHKKVHEGFRPFSCLMCTMAFKDIGPLKRHLTIAHGINAKKDDDDLDYQKTM